MPLVGGAVFVNVYLPVASVVAIWLFGIGLPLRVPLKSMLTAESPVLLAVLTYPVIVYTWVKLAVTLFAALIVTVQGPVPVHAPDHPVNIEPVVADAVKVTLVPLPYDAVPVFPAQEIVPVLAVTVPMPVPDLLIVRV